MEPREGKRTAVRRPSFVGTPEWVAGRTSNSHTPLGRLPRGLLIAIMQRLDDPVDIYMVRQTCLKFALAFSDHAFAAYHHPRLWYYRSESSSQLVAFHVSRHTMSPKQKERMMEMLCRESLISYCQDCRQNINSGKTEATIRQLCTETQYCGYCRSPHPLLLFPYYQRHRGKRNPFTSSSSAAGSTPARCILAEGRIHVCAHKSVSYEDLCAWKAWLMKMNTPRVEPKEFSEFSCVHCYWDAGLRESGDATNAGPAARFLARATGAAASALSPIWGTVVSLLAPRGLKFPGLWISFPTDVSQSEPSFLIQWTLPVLRLRSCWHSGNGLERITRRDVQAALEVAQKRHPRLLCGHISFTDGAFLRAFCIDGCSCESVANHDIPAIAVNCHLHSHNPKFTGIATDPYMRCHCERSPSLRCDYIRRPATYSLRKYEASKEEIDYSLVSAHGVRCCNCSIDYGWQRIGNHFFIRMTRKLSKYILGPEDVCSNAQFTQHLDPYSYGILDDEETKHITWCQDRRCSNSRNYSNHLREVFLAHSTGSCTSKLSLLLSSAAP